MRALLGGEGSGCKSDILVVLIKIELQLSAVRSRVSQILSRPLHRELVQLSGMGAPFGAISRAY